ncbi:MAG: endonuclease/exonuclease/phosphatase family protein [Bdellovibrionales bacterium]|nr:endonuclease/exonuclease/phosphatase family protein [Bdellovibrionales bacterium]
MAIKIMTWNLSYAYGPGSEGGERYRQKSAAHFESTLNAMGDTIKKIDPDIVLLQEVDFRSKRSHFQNQLDFLARRSGLLYRSKVITWDRLYVPYPGLNPAHHFGPILSGGGILSKTPIHPIQNDFLAKPRENSRIYNYFYLSRFLQIAEILGLRICNLHLEAFSKDNRDLHLVRLQDRLQEYDLDLAAGDFNGGAFLGEDLQDTWQSLVPGRGTFPSEAPLQPLDQFILKNLRFDSIRLEVPDTGTLSDHLPVLLTAEIAPKA